jgi:hypothetical protein
MKRNISITTWQVVHAAVPLRFVGAKPGSSVSAYDGQSARAVEAVEEEAVLQLTLKVQPVRPPSATPEQIRKAVRPPWWA